MKAQKITHKAQYLSRVQDEVTMPNKRTTKCSKIVPDVEVNTRWKFVNCPTCLRNRR